MARAGAGSLGTGVGSGETVVAIDGGLPGSTAGSSGLSLSTAPPQAVAAETIANARARTSGEDECIGLFMTTSWETLLDGNGSGNQYDRYIIVLSLFTIAQRDTRPLSLAHSQRGDGMGLPTTDAEKRDTALGAPFEAHARGAHLTASRPANVTVDRMMMPHHWTARGGARPPYWVT